MFVVVCVCVFYGGHFITISHVKVELRLENIRNTINNTIFGLGVECAIKCQLKRLCCRSMEYLCQQQHTHTHTAMGTEDHTELNCE